MVIYIFFCESLLKPQSEDMSRVETTTEATRQVLEPSKGLAFIGTRCVFNDLKFCTFGRFRSWKDVIIWGHSFVVRWMYSHETP